MNVELYKLLDSAKIFNYDESDMGEPGTLYIPPMEVPKKVPGHLWEKKTNTTFGGGPHRQSAKARFAYTIDRPKAASHPPLENQSSHQSDRSIRPASDEDARLEFPAIAMRPSIETDQNSETRHGGLIRMIIHEEDPFAFLNDDSN